MSRREGWKVRLQDMQESAQRIIQYCERINKSDDLDSDQKTFDACIRNFQILGEAAKKIPSPIQNQYSSIPWKKIKGMRDILVRNV